MLIASRHTRAKRIAMHGFSAGGLLVGAAANMRPDLWSAVIGQAPFVDMLNTMSDATHPLVPLTRPVWGDPLSSPAAYDYIASYSPYENVRKPSPIRRCLPPPPSATTGSDSGNRPSGSRPCAAAPPAAGRCFCTPRSAAGTTGASGRFDELAQLARMYAFAIWQTAAPPSA